MTAKDISGADILVCAVATAPGSAASRDKLLSVLFAVDNICLVIAGDAANVAIPAHWSTALAKEGFAPQAHQVLISSDDPVALFDDVGRRFELRAIGVQLGVGGGIDGLPGLAEAGGMTLAEGEEGDHDPDVDLIGPAAVLGGAIADFCNNMRTPSARSRPLGKLEMREVCEILHTATGHDFKHYKESTLSRRILRRLHMTRCEDFDDYLQMLKSDGEEGRALMRDLLIGVTAFFRDPDAFDALDREVIRTMISPAGPPLVRIWIAGCSTGQEAYSLAMMVHERLEAAGTDQEVQIFATDLDERALSVARRGSYPAHVAEQVGPERLARYFTKTGGRYQVVKALRQMIVFSPHNLIADPPFSRMDLITCRNVMIYLGMHLQKKLISVFHYALQDNGYLFLGASEAVTGHSDLLRVVDSRARIAQRKETGARTPITRAANGGAAPQWQTFSGDTPDDMAAISQRIILDEFAPPYLIVTDDGQVHYASGGTDPFLQLPEGQYINNLMRLVRDGIRTGVRSAWTQALKTRRKSSHEGLTVDADGDRRRTRIVVQPMPDLGKEAGTYMVVFFDLGAVAATDAAAAANPESERLFAELEAELFSARAEGEYSVQNLEAANEELKSSNEELLSMNEELQSANEELEASKEEVVHANAALEDVNTDLVNLLSSTQIATIFLDEDGNLRRFTPMAAQFYNITDQDIGRPLSHFTDRFIDLPPLPETAVLKASSEVVEAEARLEDGRVLMRRVTPYQTEDGRASGTVVTFVDVTDAKEAEAEIAASREQLRLITDHAPVMLAKLDRNLRFTFANGSYAGLFGKAAPEVMGKKAADVLGRSLFAEAEPWLARALGGTFAEHDMELAHADGAPRHLTANYAPEFDGGGHVVGLIAAVVDISGRKAAEMALAESEARFRASQLASPDGFVMLHSERSKNGSIADFVYEYVNDAALRIVGMDRDALIGSTMLTLFPGLKEAGYIDRYVEVVETDTPLTYEQLYSQDGLDAWFRATVVKISDGIGIVFSDVSERKKQEGAVAQSAARLQRVLDSVVAFVGTMTPDGILHEVNQPALNAAGLERSEVVGKPFWEAYWWAHDTAVQDQLKAAILRAANGETSRYDVKIRLKADTFIFIDFQIVPIFDETGAVIEMIPSGVDITDRLHAEDALHQNAQRLGRTLDGISAMAGLLDLDGTLTEINATAMKAIDLPKSDVVGMYFPDTPWWSVSEEVRSGVAAMIRKAAAGEVCRLDTPWKTSDGQTRWVDFTMVPQRDADGQITAIVASGSDITERREGQVALEESREQLRLATRAALLGTFDFSQADNRIKWDARSVEILGLSTSETTFEEFVDLVHPDDRADVIGEVVSGLNPEAGERLKSTEYRLNRPDGTEIWVQGNSSFILGETGRVVGTIQNITTRKLAEERQALLLGELNHRVKNSLATIQAMASHTLRNADNPQAFRDAFNGRLSAIATAHDILVGNEKSGADLKGLILSQIGPYISREDRSLSLEGPKVTLGPTVSHALGLILHELTTNATKYGALSTPAGVVTITWALVQGADPRTVRIEWVESGGPPVKSPKRRGFGSRLIETSLKHSLDGSVDMFYHSSGFCATLITPLEAEDDI